MSDFQLFIRMFLLAGTVFGGYHGYRAFREGSSNVWAGEIFVGIFFALFAATYTVWGNRRQLRRRGFDPDVVGHGVDVEEAITLPVDAPAALALCRRAITQLNRSAEVQVDAASGRVWARSRPGWTNGVGDRLECRLAPEGDTTTVHVRSRPILRMMVVVDGGKNRENVRVIRDFLLRRAGEAAPSPASRA